MSNFSQHRVGKKLVKVPRKFADVHLQAGYHTQEWGEHATPNHALLGYHEEEDVSVDYVNDHPQGAGGPEFLLTLPNGARVTVLCADVVSKYLAQARGEPPFEDTEPVVGEVPT